MRLTLNSKFYLKSLSAMVGLPLLLLFSCTNGDNNSGKSNQNQNHVLHFQSDSNYILADSSFHMKLILDSDLSGKLDINLKSFSEEVADISSDKICHFSSFEKTCNITIQPKAIGQFKVTATLPEGKNITSDVLNVIDTPFYISEFDSTLVTKGSQIHGTVALVAGFKVTAPINVVLTDAKEILSFTPSNCTLNAEGATCKIDINGVKSGDSTNIVLSAAGFKTYTSEKIEVLKTPTMVIEKFSDNPISKTSNTKARVMISADRNLKLPIKIKLDLTDNNVASLDAPECNITNENQLYCDITVQALSFGKETITATTDYFNLKADSEKLSINPSILAVVTGNDATCAIAEDKDTYCWGNNKDGEIGNEASGTGDVIVPTKVHLPEGVYLTSLYANSYNICGLTADQQLYCWGRQPSLDKLFYDKPTRINPTIPASFNNISVGDEFYCANDNDADKSLYCWGLNQRGQIGNNDYTSKLIQDPVKVIMPQDVKSLLGTVSANEHSCAFSPDGVLYCWGFGAAGTLGNGTFNDHIAHPVPVLVPESVKFTQVSLGDYHTCALSEDKNAYCWGATDLGQVGNGEFASDRLNKPVNVIMPANEKFKTIKLGGSHTCAITDSNLMYCWGRNKFGQLGNGDSSHGVDKETFSDVPVRVKFPFTEITSQTALGGNHTCSIVNTGMLYCWGYNSHGQLGNGNKVDSVYPSPVSFF